jgi:hypothetical protein
MSGHDEDVVIPPPAYIFAPFYIDQDQSWTKPWDSFTRMYLPDSLADYHSGLRPNAYYEAKARQALLRKAIEAERGNVLPKSQTSVGYGLSNAIL